MSYSVASLSLLQLIGSCLVSCILPKSSSLLLLIDLCKSETNFYDLKKRYLVSFESLRTPRGIEGQRRKGSQVRKRYINRRFTPINADNSLPVIFFTPKTSLHPIGLLALLTNPQETGCRGQLAATHGLRTTDNKTTGQVQGKAHRAKHHQY